MCTNGSQNLNVGEELEGLSSGGSGSTVDLEPSRSGAQWALTPLATLGCGPCECNCRLLLLQAD